MIAMSPTNSKYSGNGLPAINRLNIFYKNIAHITVNNKCTCRSQEGVIQRLLMAWCNIFVIGFINRTLKDWH